MEIFVLSKVRGVKFAGFGCSACNVSNIYVDKQKSFIRETLNLSNDADIRTDTIFEKLRDYYNFF